jgi:hypothetical protein
MLVVMAEQQHLTARTEEQGVVVLVDLAAQAAEAVIKQAVTRKVELEAVAQIMEAMAAILLLRLIQARRAATVVAAAVAVLVAAPAMAGLQQQIAVVGVVAGLRSLLSARH